MEVEGGLVGDEDGGFEIAPADQGAPAALQGLAAVGVAEAGARADGQAGGGEDTASCDQEANPPQARQGRIVVRADRSSDMERDRRQAVAGKPMGGDLALPELCGVPHGVRTIAASR